MLDLRVGRRTCSGGRDGNGCEGRLSPRRTVLNRGVRRQTYVQPLAGDKDFACCQISAYTASLRASSSGPIRSKIVCRLFAN
jgi:hypothetical protein